MATTSIIDVKVNSEEFKKFFEEFKEYDGRLEEAAKKWDKINQSGKNLKAFTPVKCSFR